MKNEIEDLDLLFSTKMSWIQISPHMQQSNYIKKSTINWSLL